MLRVIAVNLLRLCEGFIRNIDGRVGMTLRRVYYSRRFRRCGRNVKIEIGVVFENPENISVGNNVLFTHYSIITAGSRLGASVPDPQTRRIIKHVGNPAFRHKVGEVVIGDEVGIGPYNILQGIGGIEIRDKVTTSARVSIYSFSHHPFDENDPSRITYANSMVKSDSISCLESPVVLEEAVWLGLGVTVFGGTVGRYSFVTANSVITGNLPENSYASGNPAEKIADRFLI